MVKSKTTDRVRATEMGAGETVWTEVAKVAVKRGINGYGYGPLMFTRHIGDGKLPNGRKFNASLNLGSGDLVITVDGDKPFEGDKSRVYIIDTREVLEAIAAAEFPE